MTEPASEPYCCVDHALANAGVDPDVTTNAIEAMIGLVNIGLLQRFCGVRAGANGAVVVTASELYGFGTRL